MSEAAFALSNGKSESQTKVAMKYAIIAKEGQPGNAQVAAHFDRVKAQHDELIAKSKSEQKPTEAAKPAEGSNSMESNMRSRVKIPSVDEIEETKGENSPRNNPKPAAQIPPMNSNNYGAAPQQTT